MLEENEKLKRRTIELESSLDDGQIYVNEADISPEISTEFFVILYSIVCNLGISIN